MHRVNYCVFYLCLSVLSAVALANEPAEAKKQLKLSPGDKPLTNMTPGIKSVQPQTLVYKSVSANGTTSFSDRQPINRPFELKRYDCFACDPVSTVNWHTTPLYLRPYNRLISNAASENKLDPALIRAVIHAESSFRPSVISRKGAIGLMQLMPETATQLGVDDATLPEQNIAGGSRYLANLLKQHNGDLTLALAAYNAGASNVKKYNGIPPFAETKAYVERVAILHKRYQRAG
ncbi:lytic transglycosylase domain-containing protein [Rheinheimera baltica]|uniref:lytic transglycosylase domain-containing protein n=1 Tax=Rheinheimera baltica TaxID=67576 RepID=UPI00068638DF|nr:lytic transglycosylase domain-containing protein [Rheinheimera baltica]